MSSETENPAHAKDRLWGEIEKVRYGMLGLVGSQSGEHFQPMTAFCEPETGEIWFFTRDDTDLARACGGGAHALFVIQAKDQAFQASVRGRLERDHDRERIDRYWGPVVAAWYPEGKDDPRLTLLRFRALDAQIWLSESNPIRFFWEIAKANVSKAEPDVGQTETIDLAALRSAH